MSADRVAMTHREQYLGAINVYTKSRESLSHSS